jgi:group I intron endonuclease
MRNILNKSKSKIFSAILKHGLDKFSLEILEYCDPDKCIKREKYYIKYLSPAYNICQEPTMAPMSGRNHSYETIEKMSNTQNTGHFKKGKDNPN